MAVCGYRVAKADPSGFPANTPVSFQKELALHSVFPPHQLTQREVTHPNPEAASK